LVNTTKSPANLQIGFGSKRRVAIIPHVGIAMSHILRAIALKEILKDDFEILLVLPEKATDFMGRYFPRLDVVWITWPFGHNDAIEIRLSETVDRLKQITRDLDKIFTAFRPDVVVGIPGFQTSFVCGVLGIEHLSVLHGPWLTPDYDLDDLTSGERVVIQQWNRAIQITDTLSRIMAHAIGYKYKGYRDWLESDKICVAQYFGVPLKNGRVEVGFLTFDYGPKSFQGLPTNCVGISLGTAIPDIHENILRAAASNGMPTVVVGGKRRRTNGTLISVRSLPGTLLAKISSVAITHGGIGTIPVFAYAGVPQIFVPHDIDQAINSILATRCGIGRSVCLDYWKLRTPLGRIRPAIELEEMQQLLLNAKKMKKQIKITPPNTKGMIVKALAEMCKR
jgi:hypothetical protein